MLKMEDTLNSVPLTWSKDLIIRYLYIKLAPYFQRDLNFFLANEEEKLEQFNNGFEKKYPNIVCSTLADFYVDIYKQFNINAKKIIATSSKIPLFAVLVEGDLGWYFLDPLGDLFANQYGLRSNSFGIIPRFKTANRNYPEMVKLDKDYIADLDKDLGFTNYLNDYFKYLHKQLANRDQVYNFFAISRDENKDLRERKLQFYNDYLINLGNVNGLFERALLYKFLDDKILNRSEKRFVSSRIQKDTDYYLLYEIGSKEETILYEERKKDDKFVLIKKAKE